MTVYITRCPACQQAFKITENVLQAKNGQVRCGFCQNVFNAREHLYRSIDLEGGLKRVEHEAEVERQGVASMKSLADQLKGFDAVDDNQGLVGIRVEPKNGPEKLDIINGGSNIEVITHPAQPASETNEETEEPEEELEEENFTVPICLDDTKFRQMNHMPYNGTHVFLLNQANQVVCVGNPLLHKEIRNLYINILNLKNHEN